mgnify:CR=1 FL=1
MTPSVPRRAPSACRYSTTWDQHIDAHRLNGPLTRLCLGDKPETESLAFMRVTPSGTVARRLGQIYVQRPRSGLQPAARHSKG